jgi:quercetin dioxygenase-like cupin family protein
MTTVEVDMRETIIVKKGEAEALSVLGVEVRFLCRAENTGKAFSLMENVIPKDAGPPPHFHAWDEAYYVTSGAVEFEIAGQRQLVCAGDFVYAPSGTTHGFRGVSDQPAHMLILDAPAHAEGFFKEVDREVRPGPQNLSKVPEIGAKHGINFLVPAAASAPRGAKAAS